MAGKTNGQHSPGAPSRAHRALRGYPANRNEREVIMKKLIALTALACVAVMLVSGCAMVGGVAGGSYGGIYTQTDAAVAVGSASGSSKMGTSESTAIICVATGDSSIS